MHGKPECSNLTPSMAALPAQMLLYLKLMHDLRVHAHASACAACQEMAAELTC